MSLFGICNRIKFVLFVLSVLILKFNFGLNFVVVVWWIMFGICLFD